MLIDRRMISVLAMLIATIFFFFGKAEAATLQLEPVAIRLTPTTRSAVMHLRNSGATPMNVQVRAFRWGQADGEDRLHTTNVLRISPPIQEIPAGGEQFVRILLTEDLAASQEQTFRLIVDELPGAPATNGQVKMLIRYSVPVTLRPEGLAPAALRFRLHEDINGPVLEVENSGGQSAQLADLMLKTADSKPLAVQPGLLGYVFAGQTRRWPVALPAGTQLAPDTGITAHIDGKAGSYPLEGAR